MTCERDKNKSPRGKSGYTVDKISVGHTYAEVYLRFGDGVVVLTPSVAKRMAHDLAETVGQYEDEHGKVSIKPKSRKKESMPRKVIKSLYKSRRVSPKLVSINTKKRKK